MPVRISSNELNRRWQAVRENMKERKLDFLVIQNNIDHFLGDVRWFADAVTLDGYPLTIIFRLDEGMTVIRSGARTAPVPPLPGDYAPGIKNKIGVPIIGPLVYYYPIVAEEVVKQLSPYKNCRVGLVGTGFMASAFYKYLTAHLTSAKFEDADDWVAELRAVKSAEEIEYIRQTAALQDTLFEYVSTIVQPGRNTRDLCLDTIHRARQMGMDGINVLFASGPYGTPVTIYVRDPRVLQEGDQFITLLETNGPSGYWAEIARIFCIGKASQELEEQFEVACLMQKEAVRLLKPGARTADIWNANNEMLKRRNYIEEKRIFCHGQGYDMVERPSIDLYEPMTIKGGMNLAVHPEARSLKASGWVCDNFIIKENGDPERLHRTAQKLFII